MLFGHVEEVVRYIKSRRFRVVAEIGVWKSSFMKRVLRHSDASCVREYWAVDQWAELDARHGRMSKVTSDEWNGLYENACEKMLWFPALRVLRLHSLRAAELFPDEYFDLVFIDGSHFYEDVRDDIEAWGDKVRDGGILCGHDYGNREGVKRAVDEKFRSEQLITGRDNTWFINV